MVERQREGHMRKARLGGDFMTGELKETQELVRCLSGAVSLVSDS